MRCALLLAMLLASACDGSTGTLIVQVRTDLVPGRDFTSVRTTLGSTVVELGADEERDWGLGVRVAEIPDLEPGLQVLRVEARSDLGPVVGRPVRVDLEGVHVVTVLLTRDCQDVDCPAGGDDALDTACLAGRCVPEGCSEETPELCDAICTGPGDCPPVSGECASAQCTASGACFTTLDHGSCEDGETCDESGSCNPTDCGPFAGTSLDLVVGDATSCVLADTSTMTCWGMNGVELGLPLTDTPVPTPTVVHAGELFSQIAIGDGFICGVTPPADAGEVLCVGADSRGEVGETDGMQLRQTFHATGFVGVTSISAFAYSACGVTNLGNNLYCWGEDTERMPTWQPIQVPPDGVWESTSAATFNRCGIRLDGTLWCWGSSVSGQLAGMSADSLVPVLVGGSDTWEQVEVGNGYICGIHDDGSAWCVGSNSSGELGHLDPSSNGSSNAWGRVLGPTGRWSQLSTGWGHTCGLQEDGSLYCWGRNADGQLGIGTTDDEWQPVEVPHARRFVDVGVGVNFTCALDEERRVYCWGTNFEAQIARPEDPDIDYLRPTPVCAP